MKTLAVIPARGGSKGIPRKNIRQIANKPLIVWTIEAALRSSLLDSVIVSTDDQEIAEVARNAGAEVPFLRPAELAQDHSAGIDPLLHAISEVPGFDAVVLLQPTSPLRRTEDIDECLSLAWCYDAPSVVSVTEPEAHPFLTYRLNSDRKLERLVDALPVNRRQDLPTVYALNGALYYAQTDWVKNSRKLVAQETLGYVMSRLHSVDIDTPLDWKLAELLLMESKT